jgi:hypothetical protein
MTEHALAAAAHATQFLRGLPERPVGAGVGAARGVPAGQGLPGLGGDHDGRTREVIRRIQADGTLWAGGTTWHGMAAMRVSVSNWSTSDADVDRSVAAILEAVRDVG